MKKIILSIMTMFIISSSYSQDSKVYFGAENDFKPTIHVSDSNKKNVFASRITIKFYIIK